MMRKGEGNAEDRFVTVRVKRERGLFVMVREER